MLAVIDKFWTSCDHAATSALVLEVPQFLFIARAGGHSVMQQSMVLDLAVMAAVKGLFDAFCVIFRAPPVVPELSASFSSPRR